MKIFLTGMIALLFLVPALNAQLPVWIEGAGVVDLTSPVNVAVNGSVLIDVVKNLQLRATVVSANLTNGFRLYLGSGLNLAALLHLPANKKSKLSFYGVGAFSLFTGGDSTTISVEAGPGVMLSQSKKMKLFLEGLVNFESYSGGSDVSFAIRAGVRIR
jgi:hypothetical protein